MPAILTAEGVLSRHWSARQAQTATEQMWTPSCSVWLLSHVLAGEKFMTIFSMLFGAGLLMTSRVEAANDVWAARTIST